MGNTVLYIIGKNVILKTRHTTKSERWFLCEET